MANEISVQGSISVSKEGTTYPTGGVPQPLGINFPIAQFTLTGTDYIQNVLAVTTSQIIVPLGGLTSPHWACFWNLDSTNYIKLRPGAGLTDLVRMNAGEFCLLPLDTSITVLYAIANTATCLMRYLILPA